ncbi:MAG TPA: DUF4301 family protein [Flavobacterium sp.]|jgi:nicotinamide riboside kinase
MEENLKQLPVNSDSKFYRIAVYGPQCTGKTTLAKQLAEYYNTVYAPEFARDYLSQKSETTARIYEPTDLLPIAIGQTQLENEKLQEANKFLFVDTCVLATKVFADFYYNFSEPAIEKAARKHKYDLFFLTDIDVPWEQNDVRTQPTEREAAFEAFKLALIQNKKPFVILSGDAETRLKWAIRTLENLQTAREMGFTSTDFVQLNEHGVPLPVVADQMRILKFGIKKTILERPALEGDGIRKLSNADFKNYADFFDEQKANFKLTKFVPASGAASRMFKFLTEFLNEYDSANESINAYINRKKANELTTFLAGMEKFPFFDAVHKKLKAEFADFNAMPASQKNFHFIELLLSPGHFDFSNKPKGILPFHKYPGRIATPIEEHLKETLAYAGSNDDYNLHFTVTEVHQKHFEEIVSTVGAALEEQSGLKINTTYSYQQKATDTVAVDLNNDPFRNKEGKLVLRPGGHGALLQNLNNLDTDIIFIKNIDNVIHDHTDVIAYNKKALGGILIELQQQVFQYLQHINNNAVAENQIEEIITCLQQKLNIIITADFPKYTFENKLQHLKELLNRPLRICGMVKNEGETGGGPFWVQDRKGQVSLQIVETSQIDVHDPQQHRIFSSSTHFNPVDIVCAVKDYKGEQFDFKQFIDPESGFIVQKNKHGRELKAYELPGLWNGAMAKWITVFVEVPLITFNPVKTVNDLLKPAHQPD